MKPFKRHFSLTTVFFLVIGAPSLVDYIFPRLGFHPKGRRYRDTSFEWVTPALINGQFGVELESYLKDHSFLIHHTGAYYNELLFHLFGRIPGVVVGKNNWLFLESLSQEVEPSLVERNLLYSSNLVFDLNSILKKRDVPLYVVLIPNRSRIYPEFIYGEKPGPHNRMSFLPKLKDILVDAGVRVVWIEDDFKIAKRHSSEPLFWTADHHWSFFGAKVAAYSTAKAILENQALPKHYPPSSYCGFEKETSKTPYHTSLISLLKFVKNSPTENLFFTPQTRLIFEKCASSGNLEGQPSVGLDFHSSFGGYGFSQNLEIALNKKLDSVIFAGSGSVFSPSTVLARKLSQNPQYLDRYQFVIWVLPEDHLFRPDSEYRRTRLPLPFDPETLIEGGSIVEHKGLYAKEAGVFEVKSVSPSLKLSFGEKIRGVRLRMSATSGKRGYIFSPQEESDKRLIVLTDSSQDLDKITDYDFRFPKPVSSVDVKMEFRNLGYRLKLDKILVLK